MHFALSDGPPTILPNMGAGKTDPAKDHQRPVLDTDAFWICSTDESHVRPTAVRFENRRTPTLMAWEAYPRVSSNAKLATAAANTLTRGQRRYNSAIIMTELPMFSTSIMAGVNKAKLAQVAPTPTHNGVMALTRSALASNASASAAHWIVFAAILCSVCTTILFWLIEWRNRRCSSERENLSTAKNEWKC